MSGRSCLHSREVTFTAAWEFLGLKFLSVLIVNTEEVHRAVISLELKAKKNWDMSASHTYMQKLR